MSHLRLAILLGMTVALGPLALDTYLPAFPDIALHFGVDSAAVGLTLSVYVAVLGAGQLLGGPLSDRYGRARVLFAGLAVFAVSCVMIARAETLSQVLAWRVVQGLGGAWCAVSVPAIVRDTVRGNESARLFSLIGLIMFAAPALAPAIGTLVLVVTDWQGIFLLLAAYALLVGVLLYLGLFRRVETRRIETPLHTLLTNYAVVLKHSVAMRFVLLQALVFSVMLVFITHASFIYQEWFGLSSAVFSALFAMNVAGMAMANLLNRRLLLTLPSTLILRAGVVVQAVAATLLALSAWFQPPVYVVAALIMVAVASMGAIIPNNMSNALEFFPRLGGTAAAVMGATQFMLAGVISAVSTRLADGTLVPIALIMGACSLGAAFTVFSAVSAMQRLSAASAATAD
ncbi:MAG: multidrug effflux MFS transporter [Ectothiorhodospiraceae bacterium]|nr:multidrug effflux MFS transporter [Ectothiorhodospiraceae bacterium]MCH8506106.1 multidrug effflux MFS transporter [Ectothiorhodospiraceae bacterium]